VLKIPAHDIHGTQVLMTFFEGRQIAGAAH
jgi:hypothetical protein